MAFDNKDYSISYQTKKQNDLTFEKEFAILSVKKKFSDRVYQINTAVDRIIRQTTKKQSLDLKNARDRYEEEKDQIEEVFA